MVQCLPGLNVGSKLLFFGSKTAFVGSKCLFVGSVFNSKYYIYHIHMNIYYSLNQLNQHKNTSRVRTNYFFLAPLPPAYD